MKIIECINELQLTEKKLNASLEFIRKYAVRPSIQGDPLDGKGMERIREMVQACEDLILRHETLKRRLDYTNLMTEVDLCGKKYTIHSLILHKRLLCRLRKSIYQALDDSQARATVSEFIRNGGAENVQVIYNYKPEERERMVQGLYELESKIESALQIVNAKCDLLEPPPPPGKR